jgi:light-harvesting complex II chlorophyll a/b binding protein 5
MTAHVCLFSLLQGFSVQSAVTGEGPYANWSKHVADPFGYNLLTVLGAEERVPTL